MFRGVRCGTIEMNNVLSLRASGLACVGRRVETTGLAPFVDKATVLQFWLPISGTRTR
jgi:hypothetical protein